MPLIGFTVFKEKILSGEKCQTIRKLRKRPIKVGDALYLYWHLRQKDCEFLGVAKCTKISRILIDQHYWLGKQILCIIYGLINALTEKETDELAKKDGFANSDEMLKWFISKYPLPETFDVIQWNDINTKSTVETMLGNRTGGCQ